MADDGSITLTIYAQPGAKHTEQAGLQADRLKIRLAAPPRDGRANAELVAFLAASFEVPLRNVALVRGETTRIKTVIVTAPKARPDRDWGR